ncbi:MAG: hypothetical protein Q9225_006979 [Loekoesia sp. 1 TL-2023]
MKFTVAFSISLLAPSVLAISVRVANVEHDALDKRRTEGKILARQEVPYPSIGDSSSTSTIGILPNAAQLSTGIPALGGHSLTGHGPAIQPQPGDSNAGAGAGNGTDTGTGTDSSYTYTSSTNSDTNNPSSSSQNLQVTNYQYTSQGRSRVEITIKYGTQNVTQTWEVRNGTLQQVLPKGKMPCGTSSAYVPAGTGTSNVAAGGSLESSPYGNGTDSGAPADSSSGSGAGGVSAESSGGSYAGGATSTSGGYVPMGTGTPPRQARPDAARPGFTGP